PDPSDPGLLGLPGNDVDLYHFRVSGPVRFAFSADVFAGRIGSALDPGLTLFRLNPDSQQLEPAAPINSASYDLFTHPPRDFQQLRFDRTGSGGVAAVYYCLRVTSGRPGSVVPHLSHTYQGGFSTGPCVLNLLLLPAPDESPRVLDPSLNEGQVVTEAPTEF